MKKIIAVLICVMLLFSVAACMGNDDNKDLNTPNGTNQSDMQNNSGTGNSNGSVNNGTMNNGGTNNNMDNNKAIEDLTDDEKQSLRSRIDAIDGITFSDITFEGTRAMLRVESELDEIGDDMRRSIMDIVRAMRGDVTDVQIVR